MLNKHGFNRYHCVDLNMSVNIFCFRIGTKADATTVR